MATAVVLFIIVPVILMVALALLIRSHMRKSPDLEKMARNMPTGDAMYAMMFPDLAPLCSPKSLLEWLAWYQERRANRQIIRDGRRWHGQVPGFPAAATMAVTAQGKEDNAPELMVLQDVAGNPVFEALVEFKADGRTVLTNNAGVFTLNPNDERKVRFADDKRSFAWRGPGLWNLKGDGAMPPVSAQGQQMEVARPGVSGGAMAAGVAAGAVAGIAASRILEEREKARQARKAQRQSSLSTDY